MDPGFVKKHSRQKLLVYIGLKLYYSYAEWCTHCKKLEPKFQAADRFIGLSTHKHVKLGAVNIDTNPNLSARFFVSRLPTLIHIKDQEGYKKNKHFSLQCIKMNIIISSSHSSSTNRE